MSGNEGKTEATRIGGNLPCDPHIGHGLVGEADDRLFEDFSLTNCALKRLENNFRNQTPLRRSAVTGLLNQLLFDIVGWASLRFSLFTVPTETSARR